MGMYMLVKRGRESDSVSTDELFALMDEIPACMNGQRWTREELHERDTLVSSTASSHSCVVTIEATIPRSRAEARNDSRLQYH